MRITSRVDAVGMTDAARPPDRPRYVAFLRDFVDVERPLDHVRQRLCVDAGWLLPLVDDAAHDGETLNVRLSPSSVGTDRLGVPATVRLGRCSEHGDAALIPIRWEARTLSGLFPVLDGNLELTPLDPQSCRIGLSASYRPPFEAVGQWLDRVAFHRVAESTVRSFLTRLASHVGGGPGEVGHGESWRPG